MTMEKVKKCLKVAGFLPLALVGYMLFICSKILNAVACLVICDPGEALEELRSIANKRGSEIIKATFKDGREIILKSPDELYNIDKKRMALFVFNNTQVFCGYSDGEVDEDGEFSIFRENHGIALPFNRLIGWCYDDSKTNAEGD